MLRAVVHVPAQPEALNVRLELNQCTADRTGHWQKYLEDPASYLQEAPRLRLIPLRRTTVSNEDSNLIICIIWYLFDTYWWLLCLFVIIWILFDSYLTLICNYWWLFVFNYCKELFFCYLMIIWWLFDNYLRIINSAVPDIYQVLPSSDNYYIIRYYSEIIFIIHRK